jgi:methionine synthase II (cobalamin-independent)|tara:strand:+ start:2004 stop:2234 length:231 start_codon:yes stop_codon:yes gene_type:complete
MSKKQSKIKYWLNVDILAEEIIDEEIEDADMLKLKNYEYPSKDANYIVLGSIKVKRRTIEDAENISNSITKRTSNK